MPGIVLVVVFVALVFITIMLCVRIVPQGSKSVVQRLGKYHPGPYQGQTEDSHIRRHRRLGHHPQDRGDPGYQALRYDAKSHGRAGCG